MAPPPLYPPTGTWGGGGGPAEEHTFWDVGFGSCCTCTWTCKYQHTSEQLPAHNIVIVKFSLKSCFAKTTVAIMVMVVQDG
jgi:hypothetical protein